MNFSSQQAKDNASFDLSTSDVVLHQPALGIRQPVGVPPGLELLTRLDELHLSVTSSCCKYVPCAVTEEQIDFDDKHGQLAYVIGKKSCYCCFRDCACNCQCCGYKCNCSCNCSCKCSETYRQEFPVFDQNHQFKVINLYRELKINLLSSWCDTGFNILYADTPEGARMGRITWKKCFPVCSEGYFTVSDESNNTILRIKPPGCCDKGSSICSRTEMKMNVFPREGSKRIGKIKRKSGICGCCDEKYVVKFPMDLDVKAKALLLATPFMMMLLGI